jgi:predicted GH43/DUF377 family glycosyl hydrolase
LSVTVKRTGIVLSPDPRRVVFRPFLMEPNRIIKIMARVMSLNDEQVETELALVMREFHGRHLNAHRFFSRRFLQVREHLLTDAEPSESRRLLIGAYFTMEYSLESAALFNPSMVWHPNQSGLAPGEKRFIISMRATGEGHLSSITFRSGIIDKDCNIRMDPVSQYVAAPEPYPDAEYDAELFQRKLSELGIRGDFIDSVLSECPPRFTSTELEQAIELHTTQFLYEKSEIESPLRAMRTLVASNYSIQFDKDQKLSERVMLPNSPSERNGIEDARFVEFKDGDTSRYLATYSAYDGQIVLPQLIETRDFESFSVNTLNGTEVQNKGFALFPRRIGKEFAMLGRQDGENIFVMFSDSLHFWHSKTRILQPTFPWEYVQLGNCGSPIETEAGWLVLSHGVGPMRRYSLGAFLLDLNDPTKVIGRTSEPILSPDQNEREGYVPNVVYSCGGLIHANQLVIPYAMSDYASSFATIGVDELLGELTK